MAGGLFGSEPPVSLSSPKKLQDQQLELLTTGYFSDAKVSCGDRTWKIHRNIVCHRSEWFKKAFDGPFKEAETRIINITEFNEFEVHDLLTFVYTGNLKLYRSHGTGYMMHKCMSLWRLGDFFRLEDLCKLALDCFKDELRKASWEIAAKSRVEETEALVKNCVEFVPKLYEQGTGDLFLPLRPTTISFLVSGIHIFAKSREFMNLLREVPAFSSDWAVAVTNSAASVLPPSRLNTFGTCDKCNLGISLWGTPVNRTKWFKRQEIEFLCIQCFPPLQDLSNPDGNGCDNA